ncbi:MAG TPA: lysylphosphatidylglycerol synthase domain-containing protein [Longimicrobium sp.]|nr:lysylphosphatidylglycerol synthase domain-containing protein [Longimicrobium sp.]
MTDRRRLLRGALAALLVAATLLFLGLAVRRNWAQIRGFDWDVDPLRLGASLGVHVGVLAFGVFVWSRVLGHFEHPPVRLRLLQRIWFLSNFARYVPGKVFQLVAVTQLSRAAGLSGAVMLTSVLLHNGITIAAALVVAAWTLGGQVFGAEGSLLPAIVVTVGAMAAVHPGLLNAVLGVIPRLLKREVIRWNGSWADGLGLLLLAMANWALYGIAYHLFVGAFTDVPWRVLPALAGVNALSFAAGYLSVLPGGIGPREIAMTLLLAPYLPPGVAVVLAVVSRLWTIAAEVLGGAVAVWAGRGATPAEAAPAAAESPGR